MAKKVKPTTREHISLALELYNRIPQGRKVTAQILQEELRQSGIERDIRTIQRNLDLIVTYFNVDKDTRDKPYGYSRHLQSKFILGPREHVILGLAESYLRSVLPPALSAVIDSTFIQIQTLTLSTLIPFHISSKVHVVSDLQARLQYPQFNSVFERLCLALAYQRVITIEDKYLTRHSNIQPLGLVLAETELYLIYQQQEEKHMAINHIHTIEVSTFTFDYPANFNLEDYVIFEYKPITDEKRYQ
ncbi:WYL domain-containing protein [Photobacterium damselae]|uniref:WYL domain-containing protein n=1 Tax=Photobacterium damselae TaxID=38293 RepID=UPI0010FEAE6F|nr:WYL domain-containing protein [Photobacterium damselae]TLS67715.1 WYL domain-containing protein [Photobacterium damselae subsp. damselae]